MEKAKAFLCGCLKACRPYLPAILAVMVVISAVQTALALRGCRTGGTH